MERFRVYTDLDSLMDIRYGLLTKLLEPKKLTFEEVFADTYHKRVIDKFERKDLGITKQDFDYAFKHRNVNDLSYCKPSNLLRNLLTTVVDMNNISGKPIEVAGVDLTVNIWPYEFDNALSDYLTNEIKNNVPFIEDVTLISTPFKDIKLNTLKHYSHALSYYLFNGEEYSNFQLSIAEFSCPDLKCGVPSVHVHENLISEHLDPEIIRLLGGIALAHAITIIPVNFWLYDYIKEEA